MSINQSFSLSDHFLRMGPQSQTEVLSYMLKCYSALTDPLISRQSFEKQYNKISLGPNIAEDFPCLQGYESLEVFRQFFKNRLQDISLQNNCEVVGYPFRKIYKEIKQAYFSADCYLECSSVLSCWKLMKAKDFSLKIDEYYIHKTIDFYSLTFGSSLEGRLVNEEYVIDYENDVVVKIVLRNAKNYYEKKDQLPHFNHGFFLKQDKHVIFNNLNVIKLVQVELINMPKNKLLKRLEFQLVPFSELIQMKGIVQTPISQSVKGQCNDILNYLQNTRYMVQLETLYYKDEQYQFATRTIKQKQKKGIKTNRQLWKKMGFEQYQLCSRQPEELTKEAIFQRLILSKQLADQKSYMTYLQKYQQKLEESSDSDQKYCKNLETEIELSLLIGLAESQTKQHIKYLEKAADTFLELAKRLSLREEIQNFMLGNNQQAEQQGCIKSLFSKKVNVNVIIPIQNTARFNRNIADEFFPHAVPCEKSQKLRKFKAKICQLFRRLQEAVVQIERYGIFSKKILGIKEKIFGATVQNDFKQIYKSVHSKQGEQFSITSLKLDLEQSLQAIQSKFQVFSRILPQQSRISTEADLSNISSSIQSISMRAEEAISSFFSNIDKKRSEQAMWSCLRILDIKIDFLEGNRYTGCSIALLQSYSKRSEILFQLGDIYELEKYADKIFLQEDKTNVISFKLGLHEKLALLFYSKQTFFNCERECEQWLILYQSVFMKKPKKQLEIQSLRLKAQIMQKQIKLREGKIESQQLKKWVQDFERQADIIIKQWARRLDKNRLRCFRIQMSLIKAQAKELRVDDQRYSQILKIYEKVEGLRRQFYSEYDVKSVLISIEILRLHYLKKQFKELDSFYQRIQKAFKNTSNQELQKYKWVLNLSRFFNEKSKGLKYIGVLPARTLIENCLFDFKELEDKGEFSFEMKKQYDKVNQIYIKFMDEELKYFPKKNIFGISTTSEQVVVASYENSYGSLPNNYNRIHWLLFVDLKMLPQSIRENLRSNVFTYSQLAQRIFNIWESNQEKYGFEGRKCSTIKLIIGWSRLKEQIIDKDNEIFLQNLDQLYVIAKEQFYGHIKLLKDRLRCRVIIIAEDEEQIKRILQKVGQYENEKYSYKNVLPNCLFYIKRHSKKIHQFHTIVLSCLAEQIFEKELEEHHSTLINAFLQVNQKIGKDNIKNFLDITKKLQELRKPQKEEQKSVQSIEKLSKEIVKQYQTEGTLYPFINNTLRSLYEDVDFDWRGFRKFVYPLYHSIEYLHLQQLEQRDFQQGQKMVLWRYAEMNEGQLQLIRNLLSFHDSKPFIEFFSFLSTSESLPWVMRKLGKDANKILLRIEVKLSKLGKSIMNNGFCRIFGNQEKQILFNLLNIFRLNKIEEISIHDFIKDHGGSLSQGQLLELLSLYRERKIKVIHLTFDDFSDILNAKVKKGTDIALFQTVQSAFLKKRKKFESFDSKIRLSRYGVIEAFECLGQPAKTQRQIIARMNHREYFLKMVLGQQEQNIFIRLIRSCLKMGNVELAKKYLGEYQGKLESLKDQFTNQNERKNIARKIYDMKFSFIELFLGEKLGFQKQEDINMLEQQLAEVLQNPQCLIRKTKQVSLRLYRSIYYYEKGQMDKSFLAFNQSMKDLSIIMDMTKDIKPRLEREKIRDFCKDICQQMKERIHYYTSLNANFQYDFIRASKDLVAISTKFHQTGENGGPLEQNAKCCSVASLSIPRPLRFTNTDTRSINEQFETLSRASQLMQEEALAFNASEETQQLIQQTNFQLLGSLERHKQQIIRQSNTGMTKIMTSYDKMMEDLIGSHISYLLMEGHTRESPELISVYRRMISQKQKANHIDLTEFENELNKNICYSSLANSPRKHEEICRTWILKAEVEYARIQYQRYWKSTDSKQTYEECMKHLINAEKDLLLAYKIENQSQERTCLDYFSFKQDNYEENQRKILKLQMSEEYMMINLLKAKIYHRQFRMNDRLSKERVLSSLRQLGWLVKERGVIFDVINEEVVVSELYTIYALIIPKEINIGRECARLKDVLDRREQMKGENNIENAVDCLQLFELSSTGLKKKLGEDNYNLLYSYIEKGTRSHENNQLFWRFVIIKFYRMKVRAYCSGKQLQQHILSKLDYLHEVLTLLERYEDTNLLAFCKVYSTFQRFNQKFIQTTQVTLKVQEAVKEIEACNSKIQKRLRKEPHQIGQQQENRIRLNQSNVRIEQDQAPIRSSRQSLQQSLRNMNLPANSYISH